MEKGVEVGLEKRKIAEARMILVALAKLCFGRTDKSIRAAIGVIDDLDRLEKTTVPIISARKLERFDRSRLVGPNLDVNRTKNAIDIRRRRSVESESRLIQNKAVSRRSGISFRVNLGDIARVFSVDHNSYRLTL